MGFFYSSIAPAIEIEPFGLLKELKTFDAFKVPLLNTLILLTSGFAVTICHNTIIVGDRRKSIYSLALTIVLAMLYRRLHMNIYMQLFLQFVGCFWSCFMVISFHGVSCFRQTCFIVVIFSIN